MILIEDDKKNNNSIAKIKILGVGGGGTNIVNSMIDQGFTDIDFVVANTDIQSLNSSKAKEKIQLGVKLTKGLGAGANPEMGKKSTEEDLEKIIESFKGCDIVFITAGMGGGTGSGAIPVIAKALKDLDILSIAIVTRPFIFEGKRRMKIAQNAIDELKKLVDTLIVIPNQKLIDISDQKVSLMQAFSMINNVLHQFIRSISNIITKPGHINVDFADLKSIMKNKGFAIIGTAKASGENRAKEATLAAISSPLIENISIDGAKGVLLNITGNSNLGLHELSDAASIIYEKAHEDANIILGSLIDDNMNDEIDVTIIATGFEQDNNSDIINNNNETIELKNRKSFFNNFNDNSISSEIIKNSHELDNLDIPAILRKGHIDQKNN